MKWSLPFCKDVKTQPWAISISLAFGHVPPSSQCLLSHSCCLALSPGSHLIDQGWTSAPEKAN